MTRARSATVLGPRASELAGQADLRHRDVELGEAVVESAPEHQVSAPDQVAKTLSPGQACAGGLDALARDSLACRSAMGRRVPL